MKAHPAAERKDAMARTLPDEIVAAVTDLAEDLAAWCSEGRDAPLDAHERAVLERVRRALPRLLRAVLEASTQRAGPAAGPGVRGVPGLRAQG